MFSNVFPFENIDAIGQILLLLVHNVKNSNSMRHPLKMNIMIFAFLFDFMNWYHRIYLLEHFSEKCSQKFLKTELGVGNQNLGIKLKKFQYFHNKSINLCQNHYKPLFIANRIILYYFLKKKVTNYHFDKNALFLKDDFS